MKRQVNFKGLHGVISQKIELSASEVNPLYEPSYVISCVGNLTGKMSCVSKFEVPTTTTATTAITAITAITASSAININGSTTMATRKVHILSGSGYVMLV
jgi:hypothetical protein